MRQRGLRPGPPATASATTRRVGPPARPTIGGRAGHLLDMSRQAGNRAAVLAVQRWEAEEHERLGDTTGEVVALGGGIELTFGQIVALAGDEFGSEQDLLDAVRTPAGRANLRAHLERAALPPPVRGRLPEPTPDQRSKASGEYIELAMDNPEHFVAGGSAVGEWLGQHSKAVEAAFTAGLAGDPAGMNAALLSEAFGQHFLTDAFSSGHIRVPRQAIIDHYAGEIAPKVFDHLHDYLRERLIDEIYDQIDSQTVINEAAWVAGGVLGGMGLRTYIRRRIAGKVDAKIKIALGAGGGRSETIRKLGLGLAGLVSGAMHDRENDDGLHVVSDVYPDPWQAFGDGKLDENPVHAQRVEEAVAVSLADLRKAYDIGVEQHQEVFNLPDPLSLPGTVYFEFGRFDPPAATEAALEDVARHLRYHPDDVVHLDGHADPIGSDADNEALSQARVHAAENVLLAHGIEPSRITTDFHGERLPATRDPKRYALNRRVSVSLATDPVTGTVTDTPDDVAERLARARLLAEVGPPYAAEGHLPRAAPGLNAPLPQWTWGSISGSLRTDMNSWASGYVTRYRPEVAGSDALAPMKEDTPIGDFLIEPRPIVERLLTEVVKDPVSFLERALGSSAD